MTVKEAIEEMKSYAENSWGGLSEAFEKAIWALEKQNEIGIVSEGNDESDWVCCPCCNETLGTNEDAWNSFYANNWEAIYCHKCGQALIWKYNS